MRKRKRQRRWLAAAALLLAGGLLAASAAAVTVGAGNLEISIEGDISPTTLPRSGPPAPVTLKLEGQIKTKDGSHPPALKTLALQFDRHGQINTKGLPTCKVSQLQNTLTAQALKVCGAALVGRGRVSAQIAFPEQAPFSAGGPLLIFNGAPQGSRPVLIMHVYAHVPAPTTFVTTGVIGKGHGKYGTSTLIKIPSIVGGQGSLTSFSATVHKAWTYKGKRQSLLYASCPSGHLFAHGDFIFAEGIEISGDIVKSCRGR